MNAYEKILDLFCCPSCHGELERISSDDTWVKADDDLYCPHCKKRFLYIDGVPIFVEPYSIGWVGLQGSYERWETTDKSIPFKQFYEVVNKFCNSYSSVEDLVKLAKGWSCEENKLYQERLEHAPYIQEIIEKACTPVYDWICNHIEPMLTENSVVLDVGIGGGDVERRMNDSLGENGTVVGIDIALDCAYATKHYLKEECSKGKVILSCADFTKLPLKKDSIDIVISSGGIGHVDYLTVALDHLISAIKPNGYIITTDPESANVSPKYQHLLEEIDRSKGHEDVKARLLDKGFRLLKEVKNIGLDDSFIQTGAIYQKDF